MGDILTRRPSIVFAMLGTTLINPTTIGHLTWFEWTVVCKQLHAAAPGSWQGLVNGFSTFHDTLLVV
ncbi:MAG: hypothetical protein EBX99_06055 [Acidimicrobiia bacterium]|nr:hypothetical protein [Acidimicrobiia bacterium]